LGQSRQNALLALAPPVEGFARGRDFAAWLGLTLRQSPQRPAQQDLIGKPSRSIQINQRDKYLLPSGYGRIFERTPTTEDGAPCGVIDVATG